MNHKNYIKLDFVKMTSYKDFLNEFEALDYGVQSDIHFVWTQTVSSDGKFYVGSNFDSSFKKVLLLVIKTMISND